MMVGNHDYDLACDPDFGARLQAYNIHLDKSLYQTAECLTLMSDSGGIPESAAK
jgi:hypothetical protein